MSWKNGNDAERKALAIELADAQLLAAELMRILVTRETRSGKRLLVCMQMVCMTMATDAIFGLRKDGPNDPAFKSTLAFIYEYTAEMVEEMRSRHV